eukprot:m.128631 g.128631  ORF g.128631 m.128631 type:complete len:500 (-) comp17435_c0_seq1:134-1633(-)
MVMSTKGSLASAFTVCDDNDGKGFGTRYCRASRNLSPGMLVHTEQPLIFVATSEVDNTVPGHMEWKLVEKLLTIGKRKPWAKQFSCDADVSAVVSSESSQSLLANLLKKFSVDKDTVLLLFKCVSSNAFAVETPLLEMSQGSTFYEVSSAFNHSCDPNCISINIGVQKVFFCCRATKAGEELSHSYIPLHQLLLPQNHRRHFLHFTCHCQRCVQVERREAENCTLSRFMWPKDHGMTSVGGDIATFQYSCSSQEDVVVVATGDDLLQNAHVVKDLRKYPLSAVGLLVRYFSAYWSSFPDTLTSHGASSASKLLAENAAKLLIPSNDIMKHVPEVALACVLHRAVVTQYLTVGSGLRGVIVPKLLQSLVWLAQLHGGSFEFLGYDLTIFDREPRDRTDLYRNGNPAPSLYAIARSLGATSEDAPSPPELPAGIHLDTCNNTSCRKREVAAPIRSGHLLSGHSVDDTSAFKRCSRCCAVKYCSRSCQKDDWKFHKAICSRS